MYIVSYVIIYSIIRCLMHVNVGWVLSNARLLTIERKLNAYHYCFTLEKEMGRYVWTIAMKLKKKKKERDSFLNIGYELDFR